MDNETKQRIIEFNKRLGLRTEFIIAEEGVLGYAQNKTIYINESVEQDYERTNKHEVLHFFEDTPEFEDIKKTILSSIDKHIDQIRAEYELRYFGIYSEDEIQAGVLDNEIVIDLLVDNSIIEYENGLAVGDRLLGEIESGLEERRYLNMSVRRNVQNMNLSDWEKIFVENYYDGKEHILPQADKSRGIKREDAIRQEIEIYLEQLYNMSEEDFIIDPHSPEVIREYESEIKALQARGNDTSILEDEKERALHQIADEYSKHLYAEYKHIVDQMKEMDFEPAFKAMMLRETLTKTYKLERYEEGSKTITKKRDLHKSIAGHMVLNQETLRFIYQHANSLQEYSNFANLYIAALEVYNKSIAEKSSISLENVDTYGMGQWIKFEGKESDPEEYLSNAEKLSALVQDTPWCTKQLASSQLAQGDFYVFVDNEEQPHIAVRMAGNYIAEVRGIENGQELEEEYRDVAISFLENNQEIKGGIKWLENEEWNKRLVEYREKITNGTFLVEDVPQLIEDLCRDGYREQGGKNQNKVKLLETLGESESNRAIIAEYYGCSAKEVIIGNVRDIEHKTEDEGEIIYPVVVIGNVYFRGENGVQKIKIITGNADFRGSQVTNLGQLQSIGGYADFSNSQVTDLGQLESIGGHADFINSQVTDLGQLKSIGGHADFSGSKVTSLGQLEKIGEEASFCHSQITDIGQLESIGGSAIFKNSQITELGKLRSIGGSAVFTGSKITSLGQLESIGGDVKFRDSQVADLGQLKTIGGDVDFFWSQVAELGKLRSIGGSASFTGSKVKSLGQLESIGGYADFYHSQITDLGQLKRIGGSAVFTGSKITSLGQLESIGRDADFSNSQVADLGQLKTIGGDVDFFWSQVAELGKLRSIGGNADFRFSKIESLSQLESIGGDADFINSQVADLGELQSIGESAYFMNSRVKDLGQLKSIGRDASFTGSEIESLGQLESIGRDADFSKSRVSDLGQLKNIGGDANFEHSQVANLRNLQIIEGDAYFGNSLIIDLGELERIGRCAYFEDSLVETFGKLECIGGMVEGLYEIIQSQILGADNTERIENLIELGRKLGLSNDDIEELEELFYEKIEDESDEYGVLEKRLQSHVRLSGGAEEEIEAYMGTRQRAVRNEREKEQRDDDGHNK